MYYYNALIFDIFLIPVFFKLKFLSRFRSLKIFLSVFLAVAGGGALFHFVRDSYEIVRLGAVAGSQQFVIGRMPYFFFFGLVSGTSAAFKIRCDRKFENGVYRIIVLIFIFIVYSLLLSLTSNYQINDLPEKIQFYMGLVGVRK